ncbi:hypothetical protein ABSDF1765 [Acinetobacter baumannii SDF]|uniref:Uncharacterized protein n=1 Tax=Acinetobacter baumannii (strain SDF) TaxID=509170 RepID=B0VNM6_ACIBS|nr:hypothetical protein ABSDF1765 [Acinetobacter baumannii SDF]
MKMTRILCHWYLEYLENALIYMNKANNPFGKKALKKPDLVDQASIFITGAMNENKFST